MKIRIWEEQKDLFEVSVLEQSAEIVACGLEKLKCEGLPIVCVGRALKSDHRRLIRELTESVYRSGSVLLVTPPLGDPHLTEYFELALSVDALRRPEPESLCTIADAKLARQIHGDLKIRSDQLFETALSASVAAVDRESKPVLLRYQPSNRSGVLWLTTLHLLAYSAISDETDRQRLLSAILLSGNEVATQEWTPDKADVRVPPRRDDLVAVLVCLAALQVTRESLIKKVSERFLGIALTSEDLREILSYLQAEGLTLSVNEEGLEPSSRQQLTQAVEALGLHGYVRELRELLESQGEGDR